MSLLDELGHGIESAAKWAYNQSPAVQQQKDRQAQILRQQQLDAQRQFENSLQKNLAGAIPSEIETVGPRVPGQPPPMGTRTPNPAAQGAGQTIFDPTTGKSDYYPTASEKEQAGLNDTNSMVAPAGSETEAFLQKVAGIKPGTRLPFSHVGAVDSLGTQMRAAAEAQDKRKQVATITQEARDKLRAIGLNFESDAQVPVGQTKEFSDVLNPRDKPDAQSILSGQQGPNGGILVFNKSTQSVEEVPVPKGSKAVMTAAQTEGDKDRHIRQSELEDARNTRKTEAQAKTEEQFARQHEAAGIKKDSMQGMAQGYWDAAQTEPEGTYFPPRYVNGIVVPGPPTRMPSKGPEYDARRQDLGKTAKGFEKTAATHQAEQKRIEKARGWGEFSAPSTTPSAPAQQPTLPGAAAAQPAKKKPDPLGVR